MEQRQGSVNEIIATAEEALDDLSPAPFSPMAFSRLKDRISEYISELISESLKVAKRRQADTVSASHVDIAAGYLVSGSRRKFFRHLGTIGGIFLGAAISSLLGMAGSQQFTSQAVVITSVLGVLGAFMVALHIGKD
jgi:hypothetical protein